ncbi:unnamed protein product [Fusarium fujikuroi]|uniref:Uncharacterized protein n=1 Tax=Fusarium fujikuroi TaxID=5127 RepID=A0A9Q9RBQ6_FUSFU|nr:unnamed protein product [Fusarium fujikuroi]VTT79470.1 unnamed protein product [Fusarium fujikuroi]
MSIENLKTYGESLFATLKKSSLSEFDPFAEADEDTGETKQTQNYIHIRIQRKSPSTPATLAKGASRITSHRNLM